MKYFLRVLFVVFGALVLWELVHVRMDKVFLYGLAGLLVFAWQKKSQSNTRVGMYIFVTLAALIVCGLGFFCWGPVLLTGTTWCFRPDQWAEFGKLFLP